MKYYYTKFTRDLENDFGNHPHKQSKMLPNVCNVFCDWFKLSAGVGLHPRRPPPRRPGRAARFRSAAPRRSTGGSKPLDPFRTNPKFICILSRSIRFQKPVIYLQVLFLPQAKKRRTLSRKPPRSLSRSDASSTWITQLLNLGSDPRAIFRFCDWDFF